MIYNFSVSHVCYLDEDALPLSLFVLSVWSFVGKGADWGVEHDNDIHSPGSSPLTEDVPY